MAKKRWEDRKKLKEKVDYLNSIPNPVYRSYPKPDKIEYGQVWFLERGEMPYVVYEPQARWMGEGWVTLFPMQAKALAATGGDDLYCVEADGQFSEWVISTWYPCLVHESHFKSYYGDLCEESQRDIREMFNPRRCLRHKTGSNITLLGDPRVPIMLKILKYQTRHVRKWQNQSVKIQ